MKKVEMDEDFVYMPASSVHILYKQGWTYHRVPEAAVEEILKNKAGRVIETKKTDE